MSVPLTSEQQVFNSLQILQNVARFVGFKDVAAYSVINKATSQATRNHFGQLKAEVPELNTTFGTNREAYFGETRCLHALRAAGWTILRWESVPLNVRESLKLGGLKPDAVRFVEPSNIPVTVDFFRIKVSTGNPKSSEEIRKQQRLTSVGSTKNSVLNNASRKFSKYSGAAIAVADCSDLPVEVLSDLYIQALISEAANKSWPLGATLIFVRDMEVRRVF